MTILESIPAAIYAVIITLGVCAVLWITFRLFRPQPAGLHKNQLEQVRDLEKKWKVLLVAYHIREFTEDQGPPASFFDG